MWEVDREQIPSQSFSRPHEEVSDGCPWVGGSLQVNRGLMAPLAPLPSARPATLPPLGPVLTALGLP